MIKFSDLQPHPSIPEYHVQNADTSVLLVDIAAQLNNSLMRYKLPVKINYGAIRSRSVFNPTTQKCVTIENAKNNYYKYCITTRSQGRVALVATYVFGRESAGSAAPLLTWTENAELSADFSKLPDAKRENIREETEYYSILNRCITSVLAAL